MAIKAALGPAEDMDVRAAPRRRLGLEVVGEVAGDGSAASAAEGGPHRVLIHNISETGLLLQTAAALCVGESLWIDLPHGGATSATVIWTSADLYGCQFAQPVSPATLSAAELLSPDPPPDAAPAAERFPERLQCLREARGLSRAELARKAGISKPSLWAWEIGKRFPRHDNVLAMARALAVSEHELLFGRGAGPAEYAPLADDRAGEEVGGAAGGPGSGTSDAMAALIARSKRNIAVQAGTTPDRIRITIEL